MSKKAPQAMSKKANPGQRRVCIRPGPLFVMTQPRKYSSDIKDPRRWSASFTSKAMCGAYEGATHYGRLPGEYALVRVRGRLLAAKITDVDARQKRSAKK